MQNIRLPKCKKREEKAVYTPEQVKLIEQYAPMHRFGSEVLIMLETGVSRGELLGLKWRDMDLAQKILYIRQAVAIVPDERAGKNVTMLGEPKNIFRYRAIPISNGLCRILENMPRASEFVVCNSKGNMCNPCTWSRRHFNVFMRDMHDYYARQGADLPMFNPHQLRHTRASILVNSDISPLAVAKMLGHSNLEMTYKRYARADVEELRNRLGLTSDKNSKGRLHSQK